MARILLVEDQDDIRTVLEIALTQRGHDVDAFADGESALKAIETSWPEIAIVDSGLPGISGLDFGRALDQQTGDQKRIRKVLFTGTDSLDLREQSRIAGFDLFVRKPVSIKNLFADLEQLSDESPS